jgi:UDP-hydrolysing UDP-N-acetyl-D-glucosamine 2-epimerase
MGMTKHVAICLTSRGNYARTGTILHELDENPDVDLDIIIGGASVVRKYGTLTEMLVEDGLEVTDTFHNVIEGGKPISAAKTTGLSMMEFASELNSLDPDAVITIADRYETMAVTLAASYLNIPVLHTQGGELTGSIDDKVRHATTKIADYHFVATERSKRIVESLGEKRERVFDVGCPSIDLAKDILETDDKHYDPQEEYDGVGSDVDVTEDYLVVQHHPVPTDYQTQYEKTWEVINAVDELDVQAFWFWPNMDAGTDQVSKAIREFQNRRQPDNVKFYINLRPRDYLTVVSNSACLVGNSSVGIRECSYLGQPALNIGERQMHRERAENVLDVPCREEDIREGIQTQLASGGYDRSTLYGDGTAGKKISEIISELNLERKGPMDPGDLPGIETRHGRDLPTD